MSSFLLRTLLLSTLLCGMAACKSIENRRDLAQAESETLEKKESRVEEVAEVAGGSVPGLETKAVEVLGEIPGQKSRDSLLELASGKTKENAKISEKVQRAAYKQLGERTEPQTGAKLYKIVEKQSVHQPEALVALGKLQVEDALPIMKQQAATEKNMKAAIKGISLIETEKANETLFDLANSGSLQQRLLAITSMSHVKTDRSREVLSNIAGDEKEDAEVRIASIRSLAFTGSEETPEKLGKIYYSSTGAIEMKKAVLFANARLKNTSEEEELAYMRKAIWRRQYEQERKGSKKPSFAAKSGLSLRDRVIRYSSLPAAAKIDRALKRMSAMNGESASFVYKSYLRLYPREDFDGITARMRRGLAESRGFRFLLGRVQREYGTVALRILALRSMFGLNENEARRLYNAFRAGKI